MDDNKKRKIIAVLGGILVVIALVLFFTGKLDWLLSNDDFIENVSSYPESAVTSIEPSQSTNTDREPENSSAELNDSGSSSSKSSAESIKSSVNSSKSTQSSSKSGNTSTPVVKELRFRNKNLLEQHYEKHGKDMGFSSAEEYEKAAAQVPYTPGVLHKIEAEDGDDVYYIESTNEFVVVSTDGYLRTYFNPDRGIDYFNRQ